MLKKILYAVFVAMMFAIAVPSGAQETSQAVADLEKLAAKGNVEARARLGLIYRRGVLVKRDDAKAKAFWEKRDVREWLEASANAGNAESQWVMGVIYFVFA